MTELESQLSNERSTHQLTRNDLSAALVSQRQTLADLSAAQNRIHELEHTTAMQSSRTAQDAERIKQLQQELAREESTRRAVSTQLEEIRRQQQSGVTETSRLQREAARLQSQFDEARIAIKQLEAEKKELLSQPPPEPKTVEKIKVRSCRKYYAIFLCLVGVALV